MSTAENEDFLMGVILPLPCPLLTHQGQELIQQMSQALKLGSNIHFSPFVVYLAPILLLYLPLDQVFFSLNSLLLDTSHFHFPHTVESCFLSVFALRSLIVQLFPRISQVMDSCGAFDPFSLLCHFSSFLSFILPVRELVRVVDSYLLEGEKVLFRYFITMIDITRKYMRNGEYIFETDLDFWKIVNSLLASNSMNMESGEEQPSPSSSSKQESKTSRLSSGFKKLLIAPFSSSMSSTSSSNENCTYDSLHSKAFLRMGRGFGKSFTRDWIQAHKSKVRSQVQVFMQSHSESEMIDIINSKFVQYSEELGERSVVESIEKSSSSSSSLNEEKDTLNEERDKFVVLSTTNHYTNPSSSSSNITKDSSSSGGLTMFQKQRNKKNGFPVFISSDLFDLIPSLFDEKDSDLNNNIDNQGDFLEVGNDHEIDCCLDDNNKEQEDEGRKENEKSYYSSSLSSFLSTYSPLLIQYPQVANELALHLPSQLIEALGGHLNFRLVFSSIIHGTSFSTFLGCSSQFMKQHMLSSSSSHSTSMNSLSSSSSSTIGSSSNNTSSNNLTHQIETIDQQWNKISMRSYFDNQFQLHFNSSKHLSSSSRSNISIQSQNEEEMEKESDPNDQKKKKNFKKIEFSRSLIGGSPHQILVIETMNCGIFGVYLDGGIIPNSNRRNVMSGGDSSSLLYHETESTSSSKSSKSSSSIRCLRGYDSSFFSFVFHFNPTLEFFYPYFHTLSSKCETNEYQMNMRGRSNSSNNTNNFRHSEMSSKKSTTTNNNNNNRPTSMIFSTNSSSNSSSSSSNINQENGEETISEISSHFVSIGFDFKKGTNALHFKLKFY